MHAHAAAARGEMKRVLDQVREHALDQADVAGNQGQVAAADPRRGRRPRARGLRGELQHNVLRELRDLERLPAERDLPRVQLCQLEELLHQALEAWPCS